MQVFLLFFVNQVYVSTFYMEYLVIAVTLVQDAVEMVAVGIGDEYLSKIGTRYQVDNRLYPLGIQLVEDIVEQQEGRSTRYRASQEIKLG